MGKQKFIVLQENCKSEYLQLYTIFKYLYGFLRLRSMLGTRFVMLALSEASERLNKLTILFIA